MLQKICISISITLLLLNVIYAQAPGDTRYFGDGFVVNQTLSGLPLHWPNGELTYYISESVPNPFRSAVEAGFNAWHEHPDLSFIIQSDFIGLTSSTQWGGPADGINNVVYVTQNWTSITGAGSETVALTRIRYNAQTGRITDTDIAINAQHHKFSHNPSPPPNRYDVHNTVAHEVGHVWGLSDLFPPGHPGHNLSMGDDATNQLQTMYGVFPLRETLKRDINSGDVAGIMHIYDNLPVLNLDIVLVFDGSDNYVVTRNALTQSKNSGVELVDKLRIGDRIGVAQFPDMVVSDLKKIESNSDRVDVQTTIGGITPDGNVAVGSGLLKAQDLLANANSANNLQAIILFSAAEEEEPPWAIDVIENFPIPVYTIGFQGSPGQTTLNMISDATGGQFFLVEDSTHIPDAVNQIWTHLANQLTIFANGGLTDDIPEEAWQDGIIVDDDVEILEPGIIWLGSNLDLCLISPSGEEICPEDGLFDYIKGPTYAFYNIKNPEKGKWGLKIVVNEAENQQFFGYMRAEARDFIMTAELDKQRYIIGDEIEILVSLIGGGHPLGFGHGRFGDPITDATVQANIDFPDGSAALVTLIHQANGLYSASVSTNELPGTYKFKVTASRGEEFIRERRLSTYVATSEDEFVVQTAFTILSHIINYIENLDPDNFRPAGEGRRGSFLNKFEVVSKHMHAEEYEKAIQKLEEDILPKVDGDWVVDTDDEPASTHLVTQVSRLIDLLSDIIHMQTAMANFLEGQFIDQENVPDRFSIFQNYPNPFNPVTTIRYQLPEDVHVTLSVYNLLGQRVRTIVDDLQSAGYYTVQWNGTNHSGLVLSSGMYFYRIQAGRYSEVRKMLFMK